MNEGRVQIARHLEFKLSIDPWEHANSLWTQYGDASGFADCVRAGFPVPTNLAEVVARLMCGEAVSPVKPGTRSRAEALFILKRGLLSRQVKRWLYGVERSAWPLKSSDAERGINEQTAAIVAQLMIETIEQLGLDVTGRFNNKVTARTVERDTKGVRKTRI